MKLVKYIATERFNIEWFIFEINSFWTFSTTVHYLLIILFSLISDITYTILTGVWTSRKRCSCTLENERLSPKVHLENFCHEILRYPDVIPNVMLQILLEDDPLLIRFQFKYNIIHHTPQKYLSGRREVYIRFETTIFCKLILLQMNLIFNWSIDIFLILMSTANGRLTVKTHFIFFGHYLRVVSHKYLQEWYLIEKNIKYYSHKFFLQVHFVKW